MDRVNQPQSPRKGSRQNAAILGAIALAVWLGWWGKSRYDGKLYLAKSLWVPALDFLGGDFVVHIDHTARVWAAGNDPYRADDLVCSIFPYPPMIPRLFAWVTPFSTSTARDIWMCCLTAILGFGAIIAVKTRRSLGLTPIPATVAIAAILFSSPAIFAIERGQCDSLIVLLLIASCFLLSRNRSREEILAGAIIALAAWIKYYPGLAIVGLVALRRWKAAGACCVVGLAMGAYDFHGVMRSLENCRVVVDQFAPGRILVSTGDHSLSYGWKSLWRWTILKPLARIPGTPATILILGPIVGLVANQVRRLSRDSSSKIAFPLVTWLVAVATFFPPIANDYNLIFLPLAALTLYDPRDRAIVHILAAYLLLWLQPFHLSISGGILLACKVGGCWGVGLCLIARCRELALVPAAHHMALAGPHRIRTLRSQASELRGSDHVYE